MLFRSLPTEEKREEGEGEKEGADEDENEDNIIMYLNRVDLVVAGKDIEPAKQFGLSTYVEGYAELFPEE